MKKVFGPVSFGCTLGLLFGIPARANLIINDTLNTYQLYGKDSVTINGDAETSQDGGVGSDKLVDLPNNTIKINGNLTSGLDITGKADIDVAGFVNARGNFSIQNTSTTVFKWTNVGGSMSITSGDPESNEFKDSMFIGTAPITVAGAWANNTYIGKVIAGNVNAGNKPPELKFGINKPFPTNNMILPDTVVSFDPTKNCTTAASVTFNMSMCGLGGSATDTILPPGKYGDWVIASGNKFYLTSGTYGFKSLYLKSDLTKMLFVQPGGASSRLLIKGDLTVGSGINLIAPATYTDPSFKNGTVLIFVSGNVFFANDNRIWATVVSPNNLVRVQTGLQLYGQIFGKSIFVDNGFKGGTGLGKWIPYKNKSAGFKYSVFHYQYKE